MVVGLLLCLLSVCIEVNDVRVMLWMYDFELFVMMMFVYFCWRWLYVLVMDLVFDV